MATKELKTNVIVDGTWYGPSYPQNEVTAEVLDKITNPAAFEAPPEGNPSNSPAGAEVPGASDAEAESPKRGRGSRSESSE